MVRAWIPVLLFGSMAGAACTSSADVVCPDSSYATVDFRSGKDTVTIVPTDRPVDCVQSFAELGIEIHVYLKNCNGQPLAGIPREAIRLSNPGLCICAGGNLADADTDVGGATTFSGVLRGGGCVNTLDVTADGVRVATLPVKTNSPFPRCSIDSNALSAIATRLGIPVLYHRCSDFNESGPPTIDLSDLSCLVSCLGAQCTPYEPPSSSRPSPRTD